MFLVIERTDGTKALNRLIPIIDLSGDKTGDDNDNDKFMKCYPLKKIINFVFVGLGRLYEPLKNILKSWH